MQSGQEEKKQYSWYAARTRFGQEIKIRDRLDKLGVENFIPSEKRKNYRGKTKEHPVIPCLVFLRATREAACALKTEQAMPMEYLFDHATRTMLVIPDKQMQDFQRVFNADISEGGLVQVPLKLGERVRVEKGPLMGVEGYTMDIQGDLFVVVGLCGITFAKARIPRAYLQKI